MKSLSVATIIEKNKLASTTPFLVCLEIAVKDPATGDVVETLRLVRNNEDITYQGNLYAAFPFELSLSSEAGAVPTVRVTAKDYTKAIQARMQAYGGAVGSSVQIIVLNADNLAQPPEIVEFFEIIGASAKDYDVSFELGAENALALPFPRRRQLRDRCGWRYKSAECGYTGSLTSCDLSLQGPNGCAAHGNTINFGGFPGINNSGVRYG